jgi:ribosomal subunit interface protein
MTAANHEITYHNLDTSPALNEDINKRLKKLERYSSDITRIRVVIDCPHNHKHKGKSFHVAIEISTKGSIIPVGHDDTSVHIAVRDAFEAAERQLKSHAERSAPRKRSHTIQQLPE